MSVGYSAIELVEVGSHLAKKTAEIGDFVEQDEEIATIETDKV